jgi:predicted membrane protein (TIGR00267 family)
MSNSLEKILTNFYKDEITDREFYKKLSLRAGNLHFKEKLEYLAEIENSHADFWMDRIHDVSKEVKSITPRNFRVFYLLLLTRIIGKNLTINLLEKGEVESIRKYRVFLKTLTDKDESKELMNIIDDEISHENIFNEMGPNRESYLDKIQAFIYGMSDGLVEVLAAIAGLTAIIDNNFIIAMSGLVVGVGGTISMTLGSYLSKSSETEFKIRNIKRENLLKDEDENVYNEKINREKVRSKSSAMTTGLSYIFGAAFPIIPFLFPIGIYSLIISIILVVSVQAVSNSIIAIALNISIYKSAMRASTLSLIAALVTYSIGFIFHYYFHIFVA